MAGSSAEYDTMITLTTDLQLATKSDLTFLSGALLGENLISSRNGSELRNVAHSEEDRAARLVELIQDKVKQNPQHYYTFISVLEKNQDYYSDILKKLHKVNKRFQNEKKSGIPDSLDSVMEPSSILSLDEKIERLDEEYTEIEGLLLKGIRDCKIPHKTVLSWVQILPMTLKAQFSALLRTNAKALAEATSVDELFFIISPYSNALHPTFLEHLVKKFHDEKLRKRMTQYKEALYKFRKQTSVEEFMDKWVCTIPEGFQPFELKLSDEWRKKTLEDLEQLRIGFNRQKCCDGHMPYLKTVTTGCLAVVFALPKSCFPLKAVEDLVELSRENWIQQIITDSQRIIIGLESIESSGAQSNISDSNIQSSTQVGHKVPKGIKQSSDVEDDDTREGLERREQPESSTIIQEYDRLIDALFDSLRQQKVSISISEVVGHLNEFPEHQELNTVEDMQEFITKRSSFYDYELLKYIIECMGVKGEDLKLKLQEYERRFNMYAKRPINECPIGGTPAMPDGSFEIRVALDRNQSDLDSLEDIKRFKYRLSYILKVPVYAYQLLSVEYSSDVIFLRFVVNFSPALLHSSTNPREQLVTVQVHV